MWSAQNHHEMEKVLHEIYADNRINGEWFEFTKDAAFSVVNSIPAETRIYSKYADTYKFDYFSNITEDVKKSKKVIGVRVQKLRGDFTPEERDQLRIISIRHAALRKNLRKILGYKSRKTSWHIACNNPYPDVRPKVNIFTSLF